MRKQLLDQLHEVLRQQLFGASPDLVAGSSSSTTAPASLTPADVAARSVTTRPVSNVAAGELPFAQNQRVGGASDAHSQRKLSDASSTSLTGAAGRGSDDEQGFGAAADKERSTDTTIEIEIASNGQASPAVQGKSRETAAKERLRFTDQQ